MAKQRYFVASAFFVIAWALAVPAAAQIGGDPQPLGTTGAGQVTANPAQAAAAQSENADIIVTGSLIRGSSEDAAAPVDVISGDELAKQGAPTAVELLKNLPTSNGVTGDAN